MQNLLLDYKKIFITFSWATLIMLVGAESIGIVVELGFTHLSSGFSSKSDAALYNHRRWLKRLPISDL